MPGRHSAPRESSYTEFSLVVSGYEAASNPPPQRVEPQVTTTLFKPQWQSPADGIAGLAFALYHFDVPGFDRAPLLRSEWAQAPADPLSVWYGVANWDTDRWDWFHSDSDFIISLPSSAPYLKPPGDMFVVVLRTGTDQSALSAVRLAAPLPTAVLTLSQPYGPPPLNITMVAAGSAATEGSIVKYEFDKGDGNFVDNGLGPQFAADYPELGIYTTRLRVTDSQLGTAIATATLRVTNGWQHLYTRGNTDSVQGLAVAADGSIYACGHSRGNAELTSRAVVWKFSPAGELLWVKALPSTFDDAFARCALDFDGNLVLCGSHEDPVSGQDHALLQKWTPDGVALWTRTVEITDGASLADLTTFGTDVYLAGSVGVAPGNDDALALKVNGSGNLVWARRWSNDVTRADSFAACASFSTAAIDSFEFLAAGHYFSAALDPIPIVIGWDEDGVLTRSLRLGSGGNFGYSTGLRITGTDALDRQLNLLGYFYNGPESIQFLIRTSFTGTLHGGVQWGLPGDYYEPHDLTTVTGIPGFFVAGTVFKSSHAVGYFTGMDPAAELANYTFDWGQSSSPAIYANAIRMKDSGFVLGGTSDGAIPEREGLSGISDSFSVGLNSYVGIENPVAVTLADSAQTTASLFDGELDPADPDDRAAMLIYEPLEF